MKPVELSIAEEEGIRIVEGDPEQCLVSRVEDINRVLEACFSNETRCALLYAKNVADPFFDLSSGQAGAILQKLRNYGIRLALVCPPGTVQFSSRFGEMVAEERLRRHFGVFETRSDAQAWLCERPGER